MNKIEVKVYEFKDLSPASQNRVLRSASDLIAEDWVKCVCEKYMAMRAYNAMIVIKKIRGFDLDRWEIDLDIKFTDFAKDFSDEIMEETLRNLKWEMLTELQAIYNYTNYSQYVIDQIEINNWRFFEDGRLV